MPYFKSYQFEPAISAEELNTYLRTVISTGKEKKRLFYKGKIHAHGFEAFSIYQPKIVAITGKIKRLGNDKSALQLNARLMVKNLIFNGVVWTGITSILFFLSYLMLKEDLLYGLLGLFFSLLICTGLYFNLIGRLRHNYNRSVLLIMRTLQPAIEKQQPIKG